MPIKSLEELKTFMERQCELEPGIGIFSSPLGVESQFKDSQKELQDKGHIEIYYREQVGFATETWDGIEEITHEMKSIRVNEKGDVV